MNNSFREVLAEEVRKILSRPEKIGTSNRVDAARFVRNSAGLSLWEAREFVDRIRDTQKAQQPEPVKNAWGRGIQQSEEVHSSVFIHAAAISSPPQVAGAVEALITALESFLYEFSDKANSETVRKDHTVLAQAKQAV